MKRLGELFEKRLEAAIAQLEPFDAPPEIAPYCGVCNDLGVVRNGAEPGEPGFGMLLPCPNPDCPKGNERRLRVWNNRYKNARIPEHYRELTFQTWDALPAVMKSKKLAASMAAYLFSTAPDHYFSRADLFQALGIDDPDAGKPDRAKNCIMLFGAVGMGKTGLMAASANYLLNAGRSLIYIRQVDLIEEIQKRYGAEDYPSAEDVLRDFKTAPLLFLDEIQDESNYPDRLQKIETLIDYRRASYLPTFMTTNLNQIEFREAWGDKTADRVINMAHWIRVGGIKLRQTEKEIDAI